MNSVFWFHITSYRLQCYLLLDKTKKKNKLNCFKFYFNFPLLQWNYQIIYTFVKVNFYFNLVRILWTTPEHEIFFQWISKIWPFDFIVFQSSPLFERLVNTISCSQVIVSSPYRRSEEKAGLILTSMTGDYFYH